MPFRGSSERSEALRGNIFPSINPLDTQGALKIESLMKSVPISEALKLTKIGYFANNIELKEACYV